MNGGLIISCKVPVGSGGARAYAAKKPMEQKCLCARFSSKSGPPACPARRNFAVLLLLLLVCVGQ